MNEQQLADLFVRSDAFAALGRALDVFCPFEAIGMVNQEIRHAHFLAYVLDPQRPHGFGDACLRAFLTSAVEAQGQTTAPPSHAKGLSSLDVHLMDLQSAIVRREWHNIDLLIEVPAAKLVVAVELKIDASESKGQLARYEKTLAQERSGSRPLLLFLTKAGAEAADEGTDNWATLELESVVQALRPVVERRIGEPRAWGMLDAYISMLGRRHLTDERLEQLAAELWAKHREALDFLMDRQPDALSEAMRALIDRQGDIAKELSERTGLNVVPDSVSGTRTLRFAVQDWDKIPGLQGHGTWTPSQRLILAELRTYRGAVVTGYILLGRGDPLVRRRIYDQLCTQVGAVKDPMRFSPVWKRLASTTLLRLKEEQEVDPDIVEKLQSGFVSMAAPKLKSYNEALQKAPLL